MGWNRNRSSFIKILPVFGLACELAVGALTLKAAEPTPVTVSWPTLQTLNFNLPLAKQKGKVMALNGKRVSIPGFMVPLADDLQVVTQFLLVPYAGACIHVPPPPPNQIVFVEMKKASKIQVTWTEPIMVTGQLEISTVESPYGAVSYDLKGETVKPYQQQ